MPLTNSFGLHLLYFILINVVLFSCSGNEYHEYLYDMPGFDSGTRPNERYRNQNFSGKGLRFKEFYSDGENIPYEQNQIIDDQYRRDYIQKNVGNNLVRFRSNQPMQRGGGNYGSRFYNNPYDLPDPNLYPNGDMERYYVPPPYYQNLERSYSVPASSPYSTFERF